MLKLYKRIDGVPRYHEAWAHEGVLSEHWGVVGEEGELKEHKLSRKDNEEQAIRDILRPASEAGFSPMTTEDHIALVIEYAMKGHGTVADIDKRHSLEARMNETLGWTALGHCDGGSIGLGSMEVFCFDVDFEIAKRVIEHDLKGTEFGDYTRICTNEDL